MTVDWSPALVDRGAPWACVSNLPYNVAVPVVVRLLEEAATVERLLVMVQREVGERLAAGPGDDHVVLGDHLGDRRGAGSRACRRTRSSRGTAR